MTAPPKGEPSRITISLLYLAGRPEAVPYICPLGRVARVGGGVLASPQADPASRLPASRGRPALFKPPYFLPRLILSPPSSEHSCLSPRERWQCRQALTERGTKVTQRGQKRTHPPARPFRYINCPFSIINYQFPITCRRTGAPAGSDNNTRCPEWGARRRG